MTLSLGEIVNKRRAGVLVSVLLAGGAAVAVVGTQASSSNARVVAKTVPSPSLSTAAEKNTVDQASPATRPSPTAFARSSVRPRPARRPSAVQAAAGDPCSAVTLGKSRYTTGTARHLIFATS